MTGSLCCARWRADVRLSPVDPPGSWGFIADEPPKLKLVVQVPSTLPKPAGVVRNLQSSGDGIRHRCRIWQRNGGTCSLTRSKFRRDGSHSLCHMTMMTWPVGRRGCGGKSHYRVNFYDSTATYGGSKQPRPRPGANRGLHGQLKDGERSWAAQP